MVQAGAQCGHAAVGAVSTAPKGLLQAWEAQGQPKVCLQANEATVLDLERKAKGRSINVCLVQDAGRTQVAPGSRTVLALGPAEVDKVNELTGALKLM